MDPQEFPALIALAFDEAARLALLIAELVVRHCSAWTATLEGEFAAQREESILLKATVLQTGRTR